MNTSFKDFTEGLFSGCLRLKYQFPIGKQGHWVAGLHWEAGIQTKASMQKANFVKPSEGIIGAACILIGEGGFVMPLEYQRRGNVMTVMQLMVKLSNYDPALEVAIKDFNSGMFYGINYLSTDDMYLVFQLKE